MDPWTSQNITQKYNIKLMSAWKRANYKTVLGYASNQSEHF